MKQYTALDSVIVTGSVVMESIPNFWFALMLISLFSVRMQWLPLIYNGSIGSWIMPIIVVACMSVSQIIRVTRSSMLETIRRTMSALPGQRGRQSSILWSTMYCEIL